MVAAKLSLGDIAVDVVKKDIKNVHLSVNPPTGRVRISAPLRMNLDTIRVFAISKLGWIKQQQKKFRDQQRETPREYIDRESHYVWGKRYLLKIVEGNSTPGIELKHKKLVLHIRPGANREKRDAIVEEWYRDQLKDAVPPLIAKWEALIGVSVKGFYIQRMKTKWGSCNPTSGTIRLNTDLTKKPPQCVEYIVVHEIVHLLEPTHNARFTSLMDQFMPQWQFVRARLNRLPVRYNDWIC
jgi:predicted metal-dependent hydrolase